MDLYLLACYLWLFSFTAPYSMSVSLWDIGVPKPMLKKWINWVAILMCVCFLPSSFPPACFSVCLLAFSPVHSWIHDWDFGSMPVDLVAETSPALGRVIFGQLRGSWWPCGFETGVAGTSLTSLQRKLRQKPRETACPRPWRRISNLQWPGRETKRNRFNKVSSLHSCFFLTSYFLSDSPWNETICRQIK